MTEPASAEAVAAWIAGHAPDRFADIRLAAVEHREQHGCDVRPTGLGPLLGALAAARRPARILELGTGLGYSTLWLADGAPGALVDTVDGDAEHAELARGRFAAAGCADRVLVHEASVAAALEQLGAGYDLVFYDADPADLETFRAHLPRLLAPHALLVTSNLFPGRLEPELPGVETAAAYREAILADERLLTGFLPDGTALSARR